MFVVILSYIQFYMYLSKSCLLWNDSRLNFVSLSILGKLQFYKLKIKKKKKKKKKEKKEEKKKKHL